MNAGADDDAIVRALAPFLDDVRADLTRRIDKREPALDLQDAVERAHARDAEAVPQAYVIASRDPALLPEPPPTIERPQLIAFLDDVRGQIESHARARELAPAPNPPRRTRRLLFATLVAVAAAALLFPAISAMRRQLVDTDVDASLPAAEMDRASTPSQGESTLRRPSAKRAPAPDELPTSTPPPDEPATSAIPEPPSTAPTRTPAPQRSAPTKGPTLAELDARAQALLKAGDLGGARSALEDLVRRGGTSSYAELAFGDLFTIAHRQHRTTEQTSLWRRYLARFPDGRYADDASAGLCRSADDDACWSAYLRDWPRGSHRAEARRRLEP